MMSALCVRAASRIVSSGTIVPRSITLNPLQRNTTATMFFPISCTSPFTVVITTVARDELLESASGIYGLSQSTACFMARALFTTCGKKSLPSPKSTPTRFIPSIKAPSMISIGDLPSSISSCRSSGISSSLPFSNASAMRLSTGSEDVSAHSVCTSAPPSFISPAICISRSGASLSLSRSTSSIAERRFSGMSS